MRLHDYQEIAAGHLSRNSRAGLFLDMGLGKTAVSLAAITPDHLPVLVTAPKRVAENVWEEEARKWRPDLTIGVAAGPPAKRAAIIRSKRDITVISRDSLGDAVGASRYRTVIVDELSGFKNKSSVRWRTGKKLVAGVPYVWGLTGTPSPNGLLDLWAQMYLLDGGARLGRTFTGYRERYFMHDKRVAVVNGFPVYTWKLKPGAEERIHSLIDDICLSMESEGRISLPPVTFNAVKVPLTPQTRTIYRKMKQDLLVDLEMLGGEVHTADNAAVMSGRLSQISAGFLYPDNVAATGQHYDVIHRDKVRAVKEIVEGTGSPVLVFYRFKAERDMIAEAMPDLVHTIDEPDAVRRWNAGELPVLLTHPASTGHGLNLQHGGHTIVWATLPWSLEEWEQGNKRLDRQGQQHPVVIHMLISPGTIDEVCRRRVQEKASVQQALRDHLESPL